jgi:hypothetical protein
LFWEICDIRTIGTTSDDLTSAHIIAQTTLQTP